MKTGLKNVLDSSNTVALSEDTIFAKKCRYFTKKMLTLAKLRRPLYQKVYFPKLNVSMNVSTTFQVFSIILTSFRQGMIPPSISKQATK